MAIGQSGSPLDDEDEDLGVEDMLLLKHWEIRERIDAMARAFEEDDGRNASFNVVRRQRRSMRWLRWALRQTNAKRLREAYRAHGHRRFRKQAMNGRHHNE